MKDETLTVVATVTLEEALAAIFGAAPDDD